jgi:hypothetical protein
MVNEITVLLNSKLCLGAAGQIKPELQDNFVKLINMSLSASTWSKHNSGVKNLALFEQFINCKCIWPLDIQILRSFTVWCITVKKISSATTKAYLYSLSLAHKLQGMECVDYLKDKILNLILTGAENVKDIYNPKDYTRRAMNYSTLLLIGHKLALSEFNEYDKQVIWSACSIAFFTSVRLGEILSSKVFSFDPKTTLLWQNVKFMSKNEILMYVPSTKTKRCKGDFVDIFPLGKNNGCPVKALKKLLELSLIRKKFDNEQPVFKLDNGKLLTTNKLNQILKMLLFDIFEPGKNTISCHSFRCALPTILNEHPKIFSQEEIKSWGRWIGTSYLLYLRLHRQKRRELFKKIENFL